MKQIHVASNYSEHETLPPLEELDFTQICLNESQFLHQITDYKTNKIKKKKQKYLLMAHFQPRKCMDFLEVFILKESMLWSIHQYNTYYKLLLARLMK